MGMVTHVGRWLRPALLGPVYANGVCVTFAVLCGMREPKFGGPFANWVIAMIAGTIMAALVGVALVLVDWALLRAGVRLLPMGARAWAMGLVAPTLVVGVWFFWRPGDAGTTAAFWARMLVPMVGVALVLRLVASPRWARPA